MKKGSLKLKKKLAAPQKTLYLLQRLGLKTVQRPNQLGGNIEKNILKRSFKILRKEKPLSWK